MGKLKKRFTRNEETVFEMDHCACFCYGALCPCELYNDAEYLSLGNDLAEQGKNWEHDYNFVD